MAKGYVISARFAGKCLECGGQFAAGTKILFTPKVGARHADQAICAAQPAVAAAAPAPAPPATVGLEVFGAFAYAKSHGLKYPRVRLATETQGPVCLKVAGPQSRYHGSVLVTDGGKFGASKWYGFITPDGVWHMPKYGPPHREITSMVEAFCEAPAETAAAFGQLTGNCCFCGLGLTDARSLSVGYGPVCAGHWGLPWGEVSALLPETEVEICSGEPAPVPGLAPESADICTGGA